MPAVTASLANTDPWPEVRGKHRRTLIEAVDSESSARRFAYFIPGTAAQSTTNCSSNGTIYDSGYIATTSGNTNCQTTTIPGTPATTGSYSIPQENVHAIIRGYHVNLWCQVGFRRCGHLQPGYYNADIKGDSVWVYAADLGGKEHKIKYRNAGGW
jgi:hypothetical protein